MCIESDRLSVACICFNAVGAFAIIIFFFSFFINIVVVFVFILIFWYFANASRSVQVKRNIYFNNICVVCVQRIIIIHFFFFERCQTFFELKICNSLQFATNLLEKGDIRPLGDHCSRATCIYRCGKMQKIYRNQTEERDTLSLRTCLARFWNIQTMKSQNEFL